MNALRSAITLGLMATALTPALAESGAPAASNGARPQPRETALPPAASPSSSLLLRRLPPPADPTARQQPHALRDRSLFAIAPEPPREFAKHDLIQIVVRETSKAKSSHELDTKKEAKVDGDISAFPNLQLKDLLEFQLYAGRTSNLPAVGVDFGKEFKGEGDYQRSDDFTARLTAEVIDILPNGNLVLEARTHVKSDEEESTILVSGICRPDDVSPSNQVQSYQIHDLVVEKTSDGELSESAQKGVLTRIFDYLFAF